jgi:N-methylhydantoinase A
MSNESIPNYIGVDTGGTFTDLVLVAGEEVRTWKLPSTPDDPSRAVLEGVDRLIGDAAARVFHGSTVATNALLEGKGAEVALVVTAGFRDLLEIGRQHRSRLYALHPEKHPPLVPRDRVVEVDERLLADGCVETPLGAAEIERVVQAVKQLDCASVAICLLHAYANPMHEEALAGALAAAGLTVSVSSRVLAEFREFERASTTAVNAAVSPVMDRYLSRLESGLAGNLLRIMQSNGGAISAGTAGREGVRTILSGPAGGLVGAFAAGRRIGVEQIISFDMGGTSTDVALCAGELTTTTETVLAGWPLKVPMIDIHTVGAGGGSLACLDAGGALRVGPESAGAAPGPVCYGKGGRQVTVTDANLYLGRMLPNRFLGGRMVLDVVASRLAVEDLAAEAAITTERLAEGVLDIAEETMAAALRVVSVQRGHDPRQFTLLPFGGAGGLHACALAEKLNIPKILLPAHPGLLSAVGMVLADVIRDYSRSVLWPGTTTEEQLAAAFLSLQEQADEEMAVEGIAADGVHRERSLDLRYQGQSFELNVPYTEDFAECFHARHEELYGYRDAERALEIVTLRLRAIGPGPHVDLQQPTADGALPDQVEMQAIILAGETIECPVYDRPTLPAGFRCLGPALVIEETATHLVRPGWHLTVDEAGNLLMEQARSQQADDPEVAP